MIEKIDTDTVHEFILDKSLILFREGADSVQVLNPLAEYIWNSTRAGLAPEVIAAEIALQFGIPAAQASKDIQNVIAQWTTGLLAEPRSQKKLISSKPPKKFYSDWHPQVETTLRFPRFTVRVRYDSQEIADLMTPILGYLAISHTKDTDHVIDIAPSDSSSGYLIIADNKAVEIADSPMNAAIMTFRGITELACRRENWLATLHAGGVAWKEQGIIFPSSGGAGKTTLTAALIRHGFDYLNDDVIPLERNTGKLIPIPMSLCIKSGSWPLLQPFYPKLEQTRVFARNNLRVKFLPPPTPTTSNGYTARHLIIPTRLEGMKPVLSKISPADGLQAIMEGESLLPQPLRPADVKELTEWVGRLRCYRLTYDKLEPAVQTILKYLSKTQLLSLSST